MASVTRQWRFGRAGALTLAQGARQISRAFTSESCYDRAALAQGREARMLEISNAKIAQVVLMVREGRRAAPELRGLFERMTEEEVLSLVVVMWIGRGSFQTDEIPEAVAEALGRDAPLIDYLMGTPHLSDHLENGADALGVRLTEDEDDLIRGG
jgi:hypothetical protein